MCHRAVAEHQPHPGEVPGPRPQGGEQTAGGQDLGGFGRDADVVIPQDRLDRHGGTAQDARRVLELFDLAFVGEIALGDQQLGAPRFSFGDGHPGAALGIRGQIRWPGIGVAEATERADGRLADVAIADGPEPAEEPAGRGPQRGEGGYPPAGPAAPAEQDVVAGRGLQAPDRRRTRTDRTIRAGTCRRYGRGGDHPARRALPLPSRPGPGPVPVGVDRRRAPGAG